MSRITDLTSLAGGAGPTTNSSQQRPLTARGQVAQAPASEASPMSVTITSVTRQFGVTIPAGNWTPRGKTLPAVGAECLVVFDDVGDAFVPVWAGITTLPTSLPPNGPAGGDLSGTFPNPSLAVPTFTALTLATNVTAVGGYPPSAALQGGRVWLRGAMTNATGAGIVAGATWATLPVGMRPSVQLYVGIGVNSASGGFNYTGVSPAGVITAGVSIANTGIMFLDGVSFTIA